MVAEVRRGTEKIAKRLFSGFVNNPVLEDYSLRYAPSGFRKWSEYGVAMAALGSIAYMADLAIGGSLAIQYGFTNAFFWHFYGCNYYISNRHSHSLLFVKI
ncbi:hypothetical protein NR402_03815 [Acidithiobacillus ferrooxidans]|uniref:hypothetical protein n=1 Tax=Acidithiobacillus ferrooxidans TaxID=920 RepID=UPI001940A827|nr:hypothetical protein [Acidithiobacillus ferrooxidans]MCR2829408.1 hypothetical protein [Acidithiobacillus ferrooxidans]